MLQIQTVSPELLELLKKLMKSEVFSDFILVGGTALALQFGHRNSIDIDMFANQTIHEELFINELEKLGKIDISVTTKNIFAVKVDGIKVDFVNHIYPFLSNPIEINGIRMAQTKDIAAMKLHAIEGRGSRKDFIDLFFLLDIFSLHEMIEFYRLKYKNHSDFMMLQSLTYFYDAENFPIPKMYKEFNWKECKEKIRAEFDTLQL